VGTMRFSLVIVTLGYNKPVSLAIAGQGAVGFVLVEELHFRLVILSRLPVDVGHACLNPSPLWKVWKVSVRYIPSIF